MKILDMQDRPCPRKTWGFEEWIVNNDKYCGKRLHFEVAGGSTSLHFHVSKHETMYVENGKFTIVVVDVKTAMQTFHTLVKGQSLEIPQNTPHRIIGEVAGSVLVEFSTHHEDSDSYRIAK